MGSYANAREEVNRETTFASTTKTEAGKEVSVEIGIDPIDVSPRKDNMESDSEVK
jgi:hypothetical protein